MKQRIAPGATIDFLTPDEVVKLIPRPEQVTRIRAAQAIVLDGNGNGQDEIFKVPLGYEFEARRVALNIGSNLALGTDAVTEMVEAAEGGNQQSQSDVTLTATGDAFFLTGLIVTGLGATVGQTVQITVTPLVGAIGPSLSFPVEVPAGANTPITPLVLNFTRPIKYTTNGLGIVQITMPAFGAGNTSQSIVYTGYITTPAGSVLYLRSGGLIEYAVPQSVDGVGLPGIQTWGAEQGPYLRNGEVFEVQAIGLTPNASLDVSLEGILRRPKVVT